ncbi:MAG: hypothetical protein IPH57_05905 [Saprospiraceae bacterium]|nr:hypothetical protein [Saprospiraceae bacterium]
MASTIETGHAKNVANFLDLITFCQAYGPSYNPVKDSLKILQLQSKFELSNEMLNAAKVQKTRFDNATNERRIEFEDLKPFATRIVNAFGVSGVNKLAMDDMRSVNKKLQGTSPKKPAAPVEGSDKPAVSISSSQQSFDMQIDHFAMIIQTLEQYPAYSPNEDELKLAKLQSKLSEMKTKNAGLISAYTDYNNALIQRNVVLYDPLTGLLQVSKEVKQYVKSLFGAKSPQFRQVSGLEFKKILKD